MTTVTLPTAPNASFAFRASENVFRITIRSINNMTLVSIADDEGYLSAGIRAIKGQWLIPYKYLSGKGNFRFESEDSDEYPYYTGFNKVFNLIYYTKEEVDEIGW